LFKFQCAAGIENSSEEMLIADQFVNLTPSILPDLFETYQVQIPANLTDMCYSWKLPGTCVTNNA